MASSDGGNSARNSSSNGLALLVEAGDSTSVRLAATDVPRTPEEMCEAAERDLLLGVKSFQSGPVAGRPLLVSILGLMSAKVDFCMLMEMYRRGDLQSATYKVNGTQSLTFDGYSTIQTGKKML